MDVLDPDLLPASAAAPLEGIQHRGVGSQQLRGVIDALACSFLRLIVQHRPTQALHRRVMQADHLRHHHAFDFVARGRPGHRRHDSLQLRLIFRGVRFAAPQCATGLIDYDVIKSVGVGPTNLLEFAPPIFRAKGDYVAGLRFCRI